LSLLQVSQDKYPLHEKNLPFVVVAKNEWLQYLALFEDLTKHMNGVNFRLQEENRLLRGGYALLNLADKE